MAHTVLQFYYAEFDDCWERYPMPPDVTYVSVTESARLTVVHENSYGVIETYFFNIRERGARVLVSCQHNLVFIPADHEKLNVRRF